MRKLVAVCILDGALLLCFNDGSYSFGFIGEMPCMFGRQAEIRANELTTDADQFHDHADQSQLLALN